jgi:hypothetical protein
MEAGGSRWEFLGKTAEEAFHRNYLSSHRLVAKWLTVADRGYVFGLFCLSRSKILRGVIP